MTFLYYQIYISNAFFSFFSLIAVQSLLFFTDKGIHKNKWVFNLYIKIDFIKGIFGDSIQ